MWNIIGHERAVVALQRAIDSDRIPHALLLTGPVGVGKTRLAIELAKALNCTGDDPPCQRCTHCRQVETGSHPDVVVTERLEGKDSITIQQVRELREMASLRAFQGAKKVYVVAGAEALTLQATDALLKILEEPQPQVIIVLTAPESEALPATVVSRCRVVSLEAVETVRIARAVEERGQGPEAAERLARLAQGNVGWALRAAGQPKLADQQEELVVRLSGVMDMDLETRLRLTEQLAADRRDRTAVRRNLELLLLLGRDLLLRSQGLPAQLAFGEQLQIMDRQARRYTLAEIHAYLQNVRNAMRRIDQNVDPRLALEALLVNLP